jgi:hypothetical protein
VLRRIARRLKRQHRRYNIFRDAEHAAAGRAR